MFARKAKYWHNTITMPLDIIKAALSDNNELVDKLLDQGHDINTHEHGYTVLHIACMQGSAPLVQSLMRRHQGGTPIDFSIRTEDRNMLAWQLAFENHFDELATVVANAARIAKGSVPGGSPPSP